MKKESQINIEFKSEYDEMECLIEPYTKCKIKFLEAFDMLEKPILRDINDRTTK